ncbi:hypothetical protein GOP47_0014243 [Adiantum capillus-veneris]|uniref:SMP-30/Gluconolactonase/LRE-like region domain-containing protein n=1 Tax=Adiantum capillus-veneris TaxID=13818 RepID=A0A9D4UL35_ADICA|nr:hypothetical protein GOP47_0014243 [Adiantum capillus-veneris]
MSIAPSLHFFLTWSTILLGATSHTEAKSTAVSRTVPLHYPALYPESIVWDDGLGHFISGSLARGSLFSITENGTVDEFIRDADYSGIAATVGVTIDAPRRRILTVINNVFDHPSSFHGLAAYDLDTKARLLLAKFDKHGCPNDVTVDPNSGFAYVTDSARNLIFQISPSGDPQIFTENPLLNSQPIVAVDPPAVRSGLNGITFTEDYLLVVQSNSGKLFKGPLEFCIYCKRSSSGQILQLNISCLKGPKRHCNDRACSFSGSFYGGREGNGRFARR